MPAAPTPNEEAKGDVDLAFFQALKEKAYLRETAAASAGTPVPVAQAATPTLARPTQSLAEAVVPTSVPTRPTAKPLPAATPTVAKRVVAAAPSPRPEMVDEWADAGWTVQVNATTNPEQATDLARRLKAKGYDAYTVQAPMRGQTWYRVRVGRVKTRDKAKELENRLRNNEGMENAYVTPQ